MFKRSISYILGTRPTKSRAVTVKVPEPISPRGSVASVFNIKSIYNFIHRSIRSEFENCYCATVCIIHMYILTKRLRGPRIEQLQDPLKFSSATSMHQFCTSLLHFSSQSTWLSFIGGENAHYVY